MLLVGMDVSGDEDRSNYEYLGIVIGTNESILSLSEKMGSYPEHMSRLKDKEKENVVQSLTFDSKNRIAFCVRLDRQRIIDKIKESRKVRKQRTPTKSILRTFNRVIMQEVRCRIEEFALLHDISITEIVVQCDRDAKPFAIAGCLQHTRKGAAYRVSDYVAWCNNRNRDNDVKSIISINFTNDIPDRMMKILGLN